MEWCFDAGQRLGVIGEVHDYSGPSNEYWVLDVVGLSWRVIGSLLGSRAYYKRLVKSWDRRKRARERNSVFFYGAKDERTRKVSECASIDQGKSGLSSPSGLLGLSGAVGGMS